MPLRHCPLMSPCLLKTPKSKTSFENNSNNSGNQNNTFDGGVNGSTASFDAGVNDDPEPDPTPDRIPNLPTVPVTTMPMNLSR